MTIKNSLKGFTIVELLIVIVIIGILAAIVIVAYTGIQNRAYNSAVQSDLEQMVKRIELEAVTAGSYQPATAATGIKINKSAFDLAENNLYYCRNTTTNQYAIAARSKSKQDYKVINGTISTNPSKIYGQGTCDLVGGDVATLTVGFNVGPPATWATWAQ